MDNNPEYLIRNADTALYQAKDNGRNTYHIYSQAVHRDLAKLEMVKQLRHAVEQEALEVYYQPKVELLGHRITGLEALVRWVKDDGSDWPRPIYSYRRGYRLNYTTIRIRHADRL